MQRSFEGLAVFNSTTCDICRAAADADAPISVITDDEMLPASLSRIFIFHLSSDIALPIGEAGFRSLRQN
jgi:hypothetical protein